MNDKNPGWVPRAVLRHNPADRCRCKAIAGAVFSGMLLIGGCSPTATLKRGHELAVAGTAYSDSIVALVDATVDPTIDTDSDQLVRVRPILSTSERRTRLESANDQLKKEIAQFGQLKRNNQLIKAYFQQLQALTDSDAPKEAGAALKDLSAAITSANKTLRGSTHDAFTPAQQDYLGTIGELVVKNVQAAEVRTALERDKGIIGEQLVWQQRVVESLTSTLRQIYEINDDSVKNNEVFAPYVRNQDLSGAWKEDRRIWLKANFQIAALGQTTDAAQHLQTLWVEFLRGDQDLASLTSLLDDIQAITSTVAAFDQAERARKAKQ